MTNEFDELRKQKKLLYDQLGEQLRFFPGSKKEYEEKVGYEVEVVNFEGRSDWGLSFIEEHDERFRNPKFPFSLYNPSTLSGAPLQEILDKRIEALVNATRIVVPRVRNGTLEGGVYGLPVTKKNPQK